jgi:hypothetical protein
MNDIFQLLSALRGRSKAAVSPFASPKATAAWLKALPAGSDYDAHHALVQGLERFTADHVPASRCRMGSLLLLEEAGVPLQARVVEQYLHDRPASGLARRALWRESWAFWSLLADAWFALVRQAWRSPGSVELRPHTAEMAARALHYAGLAMRWDGHRGHAPTEAAWRRIHKIYRLVEREGYLTREIRIGERTTHCAREYALVVLMALLYQQGCRVGEIEAMARILDGYAPLPLPSRALQRGLHTHVVDLAVKQGAQLLDRATVEGPRLRYFALDTLIDALKTHDPRIAGRADPRLMRQMASLIERGGVARRNLRARRLGRLWVATGMDKVAAALGRAEPGAAQAAAQPWLLRDESSEGMGFERSDAMDLPSGRAIAVSWEPEDGAWQLLVTRWSREENGQQLVGAQLLSRYPKWVEVGAEAGDADARLRAILLPMAKPEEGASQLLLPLLQYRLAALLSLRDGDMRYQIRLGEVRECHDDWVRVAIDVVGRESVGSG